MHTVNHIHATMNAITQSYVYYYHNSIYNLQVRVSYIYAIYSIESLTLLQQTLNQQIETINSFM